MIGDIYKLTSKTSGKCYVGQAKKFMGKEYDGIHRTTFVINEKGIIEEVISDVKTKAHAAQILK